MVALQSATQASYTRLLDGLVAAGKYNWQAFVDGGDGSGPQIGRDSCQAFMRTYCAPGMQVGGAL